MEKLLRCSDVATLDCEFEGCERTEEEVLKTVLDHARSLHGFKGDLTEKERRRVHSAIREAFCVPKGGYGRKTY